MRRALCLLWLLLSLACALAAPVPLPKPNAKRPLTTESLQVLLEEERFFHIKSIERRGRATWKVVGMRGIPWAEPSWTLRTFFVSEDGGGEGRHLRIVEVAVHDVLP
jgi:hypothetical protein